jgi:CubicO group peptidase (beta-lactamase class C family)
MLILSGGLLAGPNSSLAGPAADVPPRYESAVRALDAYIVREVADKHLPALSIALVDDQEVVWARGYGFTDALSTRPATADTVYRVGSVSKLFTDIAVMQLVEKGAMSLDAPIQKYLPGFAPRDPFGEPITLRALMAHRSGLTREPPVGHYFDPSGPSLDSTIASLNSTELIYRPKTRKYSNAAIAAVGLALEKAEGQPFGPLVSRRVLEPLGMDRSGFSSTPELAKDLAGATMWSYYGREFPAPTFDLLLRPGVPRAHLRPRDRAGGEPVLDRQRPGPVPEGGLRGRGGSEGADPQAGDPPFDAERPVRRAGCGAGIRAGLLDLPISGSPEDRAWGRDLRVRHRARRPAR